MHVEFSKKLSNSLSKWLYCFTFSPSVSEGSSCSTSLLTLGVVSIFILYLKNFFIKVWLIYSVPISAGQQSDPVIYIYISPSIHSFSHIIFHHNPYQEIVYSSLCCTVEPTCLSIPNVIFASTNPKFPVHPTPSPLLLDNPKSVLYVYKSVSVF